MRSTAAAALLVVLAVPAACGRAQRDAEPRTTRLYVAASLTDVATELARRFEARSGVDTVVAAAASSTLAQQIREGAPPGVFVAAGPDWIDRLEQWDCVESGTRIDLLGNTLVVVVPHGSAQRPAALGDLADGAYRRIALADPTAVPAGTYARAALERAGVWESARGRVVAAGDVRLALAYVARGEVDAGVVYATDAAASHAVDVALRVPAELAPAIVYPMVVTRGGGGSARELHTFLRGAEARALLERAGFTHPADGAATSAR